MPIIYSNINLHSKISITEKESLKRLKTVINYHEIGFDLSYKNLKKNSGGYFFSVTYNQSKYSDVLKGIPSIKLLSDSLQFEFIGIAKHSFKPELIDLLIADKNPTVQFTDLRIYIPKYENFVSLTIQDNDDANISISFQKTKPKI